MNGSGAIKIIFSGYNFNNSTLEQPKGEYSAIVKWVTPDLGTDYLVLESTRNNLSYGNYLIQYSYGFPGYNIENPGPQYLSVIVSSGVTTSIENVKNTTCSSNNGAVTATTTSIYPNSVFTLYDTNNNIIQTNVFDGNYGFFGNLSAGTYYIVTQDNGGSSGRSETFIINDSKPLDFGLYVVPDSNCGGISSGKIIVTGITGTPPYTYLWNDFSISNSITGITTGYYSVTVTDSTGCSLVKNTFVDSVTPLGVESVYTESPTCLKSNGVIDLTISGGTSPYYYSVNNGYTNISYSKNLLLTGVSYGTYTINVTDATLCSISNTVDLTNIDGGISEVSISSTNSNCTKDDGSITIGIKNGTPPFRYILTNEKEEIESKLSYQTEYQFNNLASGNYNISVSDSIDCSFEQDVTIISEDKFTINIDSTGATFQQTNGIIHINISSGGTGPYTYSLDNVNKVVKTYLLDATINYVKGGQHTVSVMDGTGCIQYKQIFVPIFEPVNFFLNSKNVENTNDGQINVLITSGVPPFTFIWSENVPGNPQTININNLSADTYSLRLIDSNGTSLSRSVTVGGKITLSSYETYEMGSESFKVNDGTIYGLQQLLTEGYNDLISGHTDCEFVSATFIAEVYVKPIGTIMTDVFYTTTSILDIPSDNLWYDSVKSLILQVKGVSDVVIDEFNNKFEITSDVNNSALVSGPKSNINISVNLNIEYDVKCRQ